MSDLFKLQQLPTVEVTSSVSW